ncbi:hypothetical protein [Pseudomonas fluvialis]|uniref:antitoxin VbhA family protein n=1 Tax=Pseudomonas fluvialis TaxID=1793966 RepID=UPI0039088BDD
MGLSPMANNAHGLSKREMHVDHTVASAQLSGLTPSPHLAGLLSQYRAGTMSSAQLIESLKAYYRRAE